MTFEALRKVCTMGFEPVEGKVVVRPAGVGAGIRRYDIISNPIGLTIEDIALYCDCGHLRHGYHVANRQIVIHTE